MKKKLIILISICLIVLMAGCSQTESPKSSLVVIDSRGVEVTFDKIPEKVVSLVPSDTEILYALNDGDKLIAVSEYCNYPDDTANKTKLPTGEKLDIENLISLNADLVITGYMSAMEDQFKQLEAAGTKVFVTEANSLSETYEVIDMIGKVMGKEKEAATLVKNMKDGFEAIRNEVKGKASPTIYVEVSPLEWGLWTCGKNTFIQELIDIVGAKNIFDDVEGWAEVSEEQVISRNPDFIITTASPLTGINDPIGEISSRANWSGINAVRNSKIMMLNSDMITRPGPRLLDAAKELVNILY